MSSALPQLPERLVSRLREIVPADRLDAVLQSYGVVKPLCLRVNTLLASTTAVIDELRGCGITAEPMAEFEDVLSCAAETRAALVRSSAVTEGRVYLQNPASLLPVLALDVQPGQRVLDLAAAPGGKTLHIAALLQNQGQVTAVESSRPRFFRLKAQLERYGASCVTPQLTDGRRIGGLYPDSFDRVLLDAPCSGEALLGGASDENDDEQPNWSLAKIRRCAGKQLPLLQSAADACAPGGVVVYCTCTTAPEENEAVLDAFLATNGHEFEVEAINSNAVAPQVWMSGLQSWAKQSFHQSVSHAIRILPSAIFNAFFYARFRKRLEL